MGPLKGIKVLEFSGIGPGLGQELAYGAAREGAKLVIAARSTELLNKLQAEITESGSKVIAVPCDITKPADCENLISKTIDQYGRLDGLLLYRIVFQPLGTQTRFWYSMKAG